MYKNFTISAALALVVLFKLPLFGQSCSNPCPHYSPGCPCNSGIGIDTCTYPNNNGCPSGYAPAEGMCCCSGSPVVISLVEHADSKEQAFPMSSLDDGVLFTISASRTSLYPISWPVAKSRVAFVVRLPTNFQLGNPYAFDGADLFGNFTPQPPPARAHDANGYAALAVWDLKENGGNGDGRISMEDSAVRAGKVAGGIVLWIDENHDGVAQPNELFTFPQLGVSSIDVSEYRPSGWVDRRGNRFRYTAPVILSTGEQALSFDVFFVMGVLKSGS